MLRKQIRKSVKLAPMQRPNQVQIKTWRGSTYSTLSEVPVSLLPFKSFPELTLSVIPQANEFIRQQDSVISLYKPHPVVILGLPVRAAVPLGSPLVMLIVTQHCPHVILYDETAGRGALRLMFWHVNESPGQMDLACFPCRAGQANFLSGRKKVFQSIFCSNVVQYSPTPPPPSLSLPLSIIQI